MCPRSGFSSANVSFRMVLLPAPATPKIALVSPRASRKEIPLRTWLLSKLMATSSKTTASCVAHAVTTGERSISVGGAAIVECFPPAFSGSPENDHQQPRDKYIYRDD